MTERQPSGPGDVVGAITTGYQGWFTCEGDNAPMSGWWHWAPDRDGKMCAANCGTISWPDMRPYQKAYDTDFAACPDGTPARLFSQYDASTVNMHFQMMKFAAIDTAALQRFNPCGGEGPIRDAVTPLVHDAATAAGVKWYCMYDVGGWTNMRTELKNDWSTKMGKYASQPAYARQNGKPVVSVWGFGFNDGNHAFSPEECLDVIHWLQNEAGCYVIGGVPTWWRRNSQDSLDNMAEVYRAFDCVSPWMIGRAGKIRDLDYFLKEANRPDAEDLHSRGQDYQPCIMPGDLSQRQRRHGDFYWHHFYNLSQLGSRGVGLYISMFDEYNEGNQIAPTAETAASQPADFKHAALDEDGVPCTSDYYLRLTRDGGDMFKGRTPLRPLRPTEPWPGYGQHHLPRKVTIKALRCGKFMCAEGDSGKVMSNRDAAGPWEEFVLEYAPDGSGRVSIRAHTGKYLSTNADGLVTASAPKAGDNEIFELEARDNLASAIKAHNGKYIQGSDGGGDNLKADVENVGWWETWEVEDV